jgi:hypothetical protein
MCVHEEEEKEEKEEEARTSRAPVDNSFCEESIHARPTYAQAFGNLCCSESFSFQLGHLSGVNGRLPTTVNPLCLRLSDTFSLPLADDGTFKLRKTTQKLKLEPGEGVILGSGEGKTLRNESNSHTLAVQTLQEALKVSQVSGQAVDTPDKHFVTFTGKIQKCVQGRAVRPFSRTGLLFEHLLTGFELLAVKILVLRANPAVSDTHKCLI